MIPLAWIRNEPWRIFCGEETIWFERAQETSVAREVLTCGG